MSAVSKYVQLALSKSFQHGSHKINDMRIFLLCKLIAGAFDKTCAPPSKWKIFNKKTGEILKFVC